MHQTIACHLRSPPAFSPLVRLVLPCIVYILPQNELCSLLLCHRGDSVLCFLLPSSTGTYLLVSGRSTSPTHNRRFNFSPRQLGHAGIFQSLSLLSISFMYIFRWSSWSTLRLNVSVPLFYPVFCVCPASGTFTHGQQVILISSISSHAFSMLSHLFSACPMFIFFHTVPSTMAGIICPQYSLNRIYCDFNFLMSLLLTIFPFCCSRSVVLLSSTFLAWLSMVLLVPTHICFRLPSKSSVVFLTTFSYVPFVFLSIIFWTLFRALVHSSHHTVVSLTMYL